MIEQLYDYFLNSFPPGLAAFIISMLPVVELRGGLIFSAIAGIPFAKAFVLCYLGNIVPMPFILLFLRKVFSWLERFKLTSRLVKKLEEKGRKAGAKLGRYDLLGLFILVAIPLPGTGGWTGALVSVIFDLQIRRAFPAIALGILAAGGIMSVLTYLIPGLFF
ncbi:MAG: small multi-drug export protein [Clostridiales bacterium]|nr:small multi-drug export protein [Clostridiales bacterium]